MASTSQKHAELKKLSKQVKENIFDMLRLTDEILSDKKYVDEFVSESALIEMIEQQEFGHFGGNPSLSAMLRAFRANPKKATWQEYHFNIRAMIDLANPDEEKQDRAGRVDWKGKTAELEEQVESQQATIDELTSSNAELREHVEKLTTELAEMRGQLSVYKERQHRHVA